MSADRVNGNINSFLFIIVQYIVYNKKLYALFCQIKTKRKRFKYKHLKKQWRIVQKFAVQRNLKGELSFSNIGIKQVLEINIDDLVESLFEVFEMFYKMFNEWDPTYDYGFQIGLLRKNSGNAYEEDKQIKYLYKRSIFFVRNNDEKCLYAAIISASIKKTTYCQWQIYFQNQQLNIHDSQRCIQSWKITQKLFNKCKSYNLYFFTQLLFGFISIVGDDLSGEEIVQRAGSVFELNILRLTLANQNDILPSRTEDLLLVQNKTANYKGHYNVIMEYKQYVNTIKPLYKDYNYCYQHRLFTYRRNKCKNCVLVGAVDQEYYCQLCCYKHELDQNNMNHQCENCNIRVNHEPNTKCLKRNNDICQLFTPCVNCGRIHSSMSNCYAKLQHDELYFKEGLLKKDQKSYVVWDIESYFENVPEELKDKASMQHIPFLVSWCIMKYDRAKNEYTQQDFFYKNNLTFIQHGNFTPSNDQFLIKFIDHMKLVDMKYKVYDFYAHNAAAYDNYLLLSEVSKCGVENYKTDTIINNIKLLQLKLIIYILKIHLESFLCHCLNQIKTQI
ncbi:Transmembrane domain-containing protein [Spironucleus salmonicida]|uniref:Transmembrane domain-containing protein n=1 Tax=Spironucleus salmonicida TaxID=348837 RepID=A0A9P8RWK9_9EUKA|nr:Transmembrane domain-containing protein [Spironucleus salmonicida]